MFGPYKQLDVAAFRKVMQRVDADGDRVVSRSEFLHDPFVCNNDGLGSTMESSYRSLDRDGSGNVTIVQIARAMFPMADAPTLRDILTLCFWKPEASEAQDILRRKFSSRTIADLRRIFHLYDTHESGTISRKELTQALRSLHSESTSSRTHKTYDSGEVKAQSRGVQTIEAQTGQFMDRAGTDGDEELDFEAFVGLMGPSFEPDAPFVPDLDGRYRPKLFPDAAEFAKEEDTLDTVSRRARAARAEVVSSGAADDDGGDMAGAIGNTEIDEWLAEL